jgi:hypothetical protein
MKRALSTGWLYLALFILVLMLLLMIFVPNDMLPGFAQDFVQKYDIKDWGKSPNRQCSQLSESECLQNLNKGCIPSYDQQGQVFLDCRTCVRGVSCVSFQHPLACENNPCGFDCRWVVGEYREGYTLIGKCVNNDQVTELRRELRNAGFDATSITFGRGLTINHIADGNCSIYRTEHNDTLIIDHIGPFLGIHMQSQEPVAYGLSGTTVLFNTLCGGINP